MFPCLSFSFRPCLGAKVSKAALCSFSPKGTRNFQPRPTQTAPHSPGEKRFLGDIQGPKSPLCIPRFLLVATQVLNLSASLDCPCQDLCWQLHGRKAKASYLVHVSELAVLLMLQQNLCSVSTPRDPFRLLTPLLGGGGGEAQYPDPVMGPTPHQPVSGVDACTSVTTFPVSGPDRIAGTHSSSASWGD